jgi:hypothetical protein
MTFKDIERKALRLGATDVKRANTKNHKYFVIYNGKKINFGHKDYEDFTQHNDPVRRERYRARASKIKNKHNQLTYKLKTSPNFWAYNLLW